MFDVIILVIQLADASHNSEKFGISAIYCTLIVSNIDL